MLNIAQRPLSKTKPKQHTRDDGGKQFRYPKRMPYARCLKQVRHKKRYGKNGDIPKQRYYQRRHAFAQRLERAADDNGDRRNDKPGAYDAQGDRSLFHRLRSIGKYVHQLLRNCKAEVGTARQRIVPITITPRLSNNVTLNMLMTLSFRPAPRL